MIIVKNFIDFLKNNKISFFTGIPDSILKDFCTYIDNNINKSKHIVSANEGTALGIAAGYNLATNQIPLVYLQIGLSSTTPYHKIEIYWEFQTLACL